MFTRPATLIIASLFALSGALAHAKVAPSIDMEGQSRDQVLQQLIDQPQSNEMCEIDQSQAADGIGGIQSIGSAESALSLVGGLDDTCPIPAPMPNPFDNVASL